MAKTSLKLSSTKISELRNWVRYSRPKGL